MSHAFLGAINSNSGTKDYLFGISAKALIINTEGNILVVKERGRDWWDLPGGGMEHGETIKDCIARELHEEVSLSGDFSYSTLLVEDAKPLIRADIWQIRATFIVRPALMPSTTGEEGDEIAFLSPDHFKQSTQESSQKIYEYWQLAKRYKYI